MIKYKNKLLKKQKSNTATEIDKMKIEKHIIKLNFGIDKINKDFLISFYKKDHVLFNLLGLIDDKNIKGQNNFIDINKINYDIDKEKEKNAIIRDIIILLGYENIFDHNKIDKEKFIENYQKVMNKSKLFTERHYSFPLFGLKKKVQINTIKGFLGFINVLLKNYGINIKLDRKSKKNKKKVIKICTYQIDFINNIHEFIKYKIIKGYCLYNSEDIKIYEKKYIWMNLINKKNKL